MLLAGYKVKMLISSSGLEVIQVYIEVMQRPFGLELFLSSRHRHDLGNDLGYFTFC